MSEFSYIEGMVDGQAPDSMGRSPVEQAYKVSLQQKNGKNQNPAAALSGKVKFSDLFKGFKVSINGLTAMFFVGYALWLVVIYFIRHNEPFANQVLGTPNAGAPTSHADRLIVGGAKYALPINATGNLGFYTPDKKNHQVQPQATGTLPSMGDPSSFKKQSEMAFTEGQAPQVISPTDGSAAYGHSRIVHYGRERVIIAHPEPLPGELNNQQQAQPQQTYAAAPSAMPQQDFGMPTQAAGFAHHQLGSNAYNSQPANGDTSVRYNMPVQTQDGLKLRTVVSR